MVRSGEGENEHLLSAYLSLDKHKSVSRPTLRQRRWTIFSRATGILFLVGFGGVTSGSSSPVVILGFWVALLAVGGWLAAISLHVYRAVGDDSAPTLD